MAKQEDDNLLSRLKEDMKDSLLISEVFEKYYHQLRKVKTDAYTALCPFHSDKNDGTFHVSDSKSIYKCFGCGAYGDIITLVEKRFNCDFVDAVYILARDFGYITQEAFEKRNVNFDEQYEIIKQEKTARKLEEINSIEADLADASVIEKVYEVFSEMSPLKPSDYTYLKDKRGLDEESIKNTYFTMPYCTQGFMRKFNDKLKEVGLSENDLIGVPGFYFDEEKSKIVFIGVRGIGIKVRNHAGNIVGIQVRLTNARVDKKTGKQQRYVWFSSPKRKLGCSSGSPVDVTYPKLPNEDIKAVVFITEGKFKSEKIAKVYDSVSISVQGITSWKDKIGEEIKGISEKVSLKGVFLCYDADISVNPQVFYQCKMMVENELKGCFHENNIYMVSWDSSLGKGIDDLIDSGNKDAVRKMRFNDYVSIYESFLNEYERNEKNEIIDGDTGELISKDKLYSDYMEKVFPLIKG